MFYAVINTTKLQGITGGGSGDAPALCQVIRRRDHTLTATEGDFAIQGELPQPGKGADWNLDAGRSWRVYSVRFVRGASGVANWRYVTPSKGGTTAWEGGRLEFGCRMLLQGVLGEVLAERLGTGSWWFATDGWQLAVDGWQDGSQASWLDASRAWGVCRQQVVHG